MNKNASTNPVKHPVKKFKTMAGMLLLALVVLAASLSANFTSAQARQSDELCGDGSAPGYGLDYDKLQPHWTVGWEGYASQTTVNEVDRVLDELDAGSVAQTMILIKPQDEVGIRTNCAVHFLRYMKLGLPSGERKDNGFVFLIVQEDDEIDVHYAVGLGLPALTARELTNINRIAEDTYESTKSMDQALLALVNEFDKIARENYPPLTTPHQAPETGVVLDNPASISALCCLVCIGLLFLLFVLWILSKMGGGGRGFSRGGGSRSWGGGFPSGGFRFPSGGRGRSSFPRMRGGGGSGRSGRTN